MKYLTKEDVGEVLGISRSSVYNLRRIGLIPEPCKIAKYKIGTCGTPLWNAAIIMKVHDKILEDRKVRDNRIIKAYEKMVKINEITKEFKISSNTMYKILKDAGVNKNRSQRGLKVYKSILIKDIQKPTLVKDAFNLFMINNVRCAL